MPTLWEAQSLQTDVTAKSWCIKVTPKNTIHSVLSPKLHIHKGCLDDYHLIVGKKYLILSYLKSIYLKEIFNLGINIAVFPEECIT